MFNLSDLNNRFKWTADEHDGWDFLTAPTGQLRGDCDDYACTALLIEAGGSLWRFWFWVLTFQAVFWYTRYNGTSHLMVWRRGRGWIDNTKPFWGARRLPLRFPATPVVVGWKLWL